MKRLKNFLPAILLLVPDLAFSTYGRQEPGSAPGSAAAFNEEPALSLLPARAQVSVLKPGSVLLAGLLGKILGPIGFLLAALDGRLPWRAGWTILSNDLIW